MPHSRMCFRKTAAALAALMLAACAAIPRAEPDPTGRLDILAPAPGFLEEPLAGEWIRIGPEPPAGPGYRTAILDGVPALRIDSGERIGLLVRRTDAPLLAIPYLSWAWRVEKAAGELHPVRVIVGFHGGDPASHSWGSDPLVWTGTALPPHDRILALGWGHSALRRGTLGPPREDPDAPRTYVVRGGAEYNGTWHLETVDLARLYGEAWPRDNAGRARITFVGIAATASPLPATAHLSGLTLSR